MNIAYDDNSHTLQLVFWLWLMTHITFGVILAIQLGYTIRIYESVESVREVLEFITTGNNMLAR